MVKCKKVLITYTNFDVTLTTTSIDCLPLSPASQSKHALKICLIVYVHCAGEYLPT